MTKKKVPAAVRAYMASLGALGGAKGKGNPERSALNRKAAQVRWAKAKEEA